MNLHVRKMDLLTAIEIVSWQYPPPYELYSLNSSARALVKLIEGQYLAIYLEKQILGFFCYGPAARLGKHADHQLYADNNYLDVGLGMHPEFCGRGLGARFVKQGLKHVRKEGWTGGFRLTVASNNQRALTVYTRLGFREIGAIIWDHRLSQTFLVLTLDIL